MVLQANWAERTVFILHSADLVYSSGNQESISPGRPGGPDYTETVGQTGVLQTPFRKPGCNESGKGHFVCRTACSSMPMLSPQKGIRPQAGFSRFVEGDVIIRQGDEAEYVYPCYEEALPSSVQDGMVVGVIEEGEILAPFAALTSKRTAAVTAASSCTVMSVPRISSLS